MDCEQRQRIFERCEPDLLTACGGYVQAWFDVTRLRNGLGGVGSRIYETRLNFWMLACMGVADSQLMHLRSIEVIRYAFVPLGRFHYVLM